VKSIREAIEKDIDGDIVGAAKAYEDVILAGSSPLDCYINLSVLYWQCTDFGFNSNLKLDPVFVKSAGVRYTQILHDANEQFVNQPEIKFWELYFDYISLGGPSFIDECKEIVQNPACSLVPYFYLLKMAGEKEFKPQVLKLIEHCRTSLTTKNKYIISVVESCFNKTG
jgi:hypothetical protein